jgi:hypothetical protein
LVGKRCHRPPVQYSRPAFVVHLDLRLTRTSAIRQWKEDAMQFTGMGYSAALAVVLAAGPANMALAQSADVSANATAGLTLVAQQQTYLDVMANLEAAGYTVVKTKTTFLGRVQITARNATHLREVVVSRATGEVKSDVILETFATGDAAAAIGALPAATETEAEETGGILDFLGLGGTSSNAATSARDSATAATDSLGNSLSGGSSGVSGVTGGVSGSVGGSASGSGGSASGSVSGGLGL